MADPSAGGAANSQKITRASAKRVKHDNVESAKGSTEVGQVKPKRVNRIKGRLSSLPDLPLDVMTEIFSHVDPLDVLHLSWVSKNFHTFLMRRSSAFIWRNALANVSGLPDLPPDLNEIQYTKLAFASLCTFCGASGIRKLEWRLRCRACPRCAKVEFDDKASSYVYFKDDEDVGHDVLMMPSDCRPLLLHKEGRKSCSITVRKGTKEELKATVNALADVQARNAWRKQRAEEIGAILKHAALCEQWSATRKGDRAAELDIMRSQRKQSIVAKLKELGWADEFAKMTNGEKANFYMHKHVRVSTKLTAQGWIKIRDDLVQCMEDVRARRLAQERRKLIKTRRETAACVLNAWKIDQLRAHGDLPLLPAAADFALFADVAAVVERPIEDDVTPASFALAVENMQAMLPIWRAKLQDLLTKRLVVLLTPKKRTYLDFFGFGTLSDEESDSEEEVTTVTETVTEEHATERLALATTTFSCTLCTPFSAGDNDPLWMDSDSDSEDTEFGCGSRPLWYPEVLGHHCLTVGMGALMWRKAGEEVNGHSPWSARALTLNTKTSALAEQFIRACGLDVEKATAVEMDAVGARFKCGAAGCGNRMDWRAAVAHDGTHSLSYQKVKWTQLDEEEARAVKELEGTLGVDMEQWVCVHCVDLRRQTRPDTAAKIEEHIKGVHTISEPRRGTDYFRTPEQTHVVVHALA